MKSKVKELVGVITSIRDLNRIMEYINADIYAIYKGRIEYEFKDENGVDNKIIVYYESDKDVYLGDKCIRITNVEVITFDFPKK